MKTWFKMAILGLMLFFPVVASAAILADIEVAGTVWMESPSGDLGYEGDLLDVEGDLGFGEETRIGGRIKADIPLLPELSLMYTPQSYDETSVISRTFQFGGETYSASDEVSTELTLDHLDLAVAFGIPFLETATLDTLSVKLGLDLRYYQFDAELVQGATRESKDLDLVLPMVYGFFRFTPMEALSFEVEGRGITFDGDSAVSLMGRVRYQAMGPIFASVGYRSDMVDVDKDDVRIDTTFEGPFFEVGVKF